MPFLNFLLLVTIASSLSSFLLLDVKAESEQSSTKLCDPSSKYQCKSGECIPKSYVCNGNVDCASRDDELSCDIWQCSDTSKFFKCRDGLGCIAKTLRCDDQGDCKDNSDESDEECGETEAKKRACDEHNEFECSPGICIPIQDKCDGIKQCFNGRDEEKCTFNNVTCHGFLCKNGICLSSHEYECDGIIDCLDGSDEDHCMKECVLSNRKFLCKKGDECIDLVKVCDGNKDCHDESDEGNHCDDVKNKLPDPCKNFKCSGECVVQPEGPGCVCQKGYFHNNVTGSCDDINECDHYGICSQQCANTPGSYYCSCAKGFLLSPDKRSCESTSVNVHLVYTSKKYIKRITFSSNYHDVVTKTSRPIGITSDGEYYYWTEVSSGKEAIVKMHVNSTQKLVLFTNGLELPEDIAVDWLTKNLYFTDSSRNHVAVCTNDGFYCTELVQSREMERVRSIALYPAESLLFWSDWGAEAHIGVSFMDGSDARVLIDNVAWPNGIAIDWFNRRIYWIDARNTQIESATIQGKDRRVILSDVFKHPFSIVVHGNRLYWSDKGTKAIEYCDKFTGKNHDILTYGYDIFDLHIHDENLMPQQNHACKINQCSHICLLSSNKSYTCACPVNMKLKSNLHDCVSDSQIFNIITGVGNNIASTPYQVFGRHETKDAFPLGRIFVDRIEANTEKGSIFVADNRAHVIIEYDLNGEKSIELVSRDISHVTSMSYDYIGNNLFWCDKEKGTIEVFSLNTNKRAIIQHYAGDYKVVAIALMPSQGEMFVALQSKNHTHIDRQSMKGDMVEGSHHVHVIETGLSTAGSIHLAIDEEAKKLYWSDSKRKVIEFSNFDGTSRKSFARTSKSPLTIAIIGDDLYWTLEQSGACQYKKKIGDGPIKIFQISLPKGAGYDNFINIASGAPRKMSSNPCRFNNGGCSDICLSDGADSFVCKCASGYDFLNDKKLSCVSHSICDFRCGSGECIEAKKRCDTRADCIDGSDEGEMCNKEVCRMDQFRCGDGQCIDLRFKCDDDYQCKDKSDEANCEFKCLKNQIKCPVQELCVNVTQLCDSNKNCDDGYDEKKEVCDLPCPENYFKCISGQCIPKEFECNFRIDCNDGSDEHDQCKGNICEPSMKPCRNGFCISSSMFCDGHPDCDDNFDEANCDRPKASCDIDEFQCKLEPDVCIKNEQQCDGIRDCKGGEDEKGCPSCQRGSFECDNGNCILEEQHCDGFSDCLDHSDEKNCDKDSKNPPVAEVCTGYQCGNGRCLDFTKVCDGTADCDDDEGPKCHTVCKESLCEYKEGCKATPKGAICTCKDGFKLKSSGDYKCEDIDECLGEPCSQICDNTIGSYNCLCHEGYITTNDKHFCKALGEPAKLFFIKNQDILVRTEHSLKKVIEGNFTIADFAVDLHREKIIFVYEHLNGLFSFDMKTREISMMENVSTPLKILHDWVTDNIYVFSLENFTSSKLSICNLEKKVCVLLKKFGFNQYVKSADIDPINRWIFYVQKTALSVFTKTDDTINKIRLNGNEDGEIYKAKDISALAIDIDSQRVIYTSKANQSLQSINYDGGKQKTFVTRSKMLQAPSNVAVFESHAYVINQLSAQLIRCKLYDDKECSVTPDLNLGNSPKLMIAHKMKQRKVENTCEDNLCRDICTITDSGKRCMCNEKNERIVCDEMVQKISLKSSENSSEKSSRAWVWTLLSLLIIAGLVVASIYIYRRRGFHTNFNISMYFRNNELFSEFSNRQQPKSPPPHTQIYPRAPPTIVDKMGKNYEVINNDFPTSTYQSMEQMQNFSDEEFMEDAESNCNDQKQRLIV